MSKVHVTRFTIEFGDCDPAGIVFYPNYLRWMDAASLHYFRAMGVPPWQELAAQTGIIGTPIVDVSARFVRSASYGDIIDVESTIAEWRGKSFLFRHVIRRGEESWSRAGSSHLRSAQPRRPRRIQAVAAPEAFRRLCE
jgi:4-hydroxybenzoyl-CoA thioesterase